MTISPQTAQLASRVLARFPRPSDAYPEKWPTDPSDLLLTMHSLFVQKNYQAELVKLLAGQNIPARELSELTGVEVHVCPSYPEGVAKLRRETVTVRRRRKYVRKSDPRVIVEVLPNPKKPGSAARARYENYRVGATVDEVLESGLMPGDIRWDEERGHIKLEARNGR